MGARDRQWKDLSQRFGCDSPNLRLCCVRTPGVKTLPKHLHGLLWLTPMTVFVLKILGYLELHS